MSKILLVEDNPEFAKSAVSYLTSMNQSVNLATDYRDAIIALEDPGIDAVITDCFFPEQTGSGKRELGKDLVRRMAEVDPYEIRIAQTIKLLEPYIITEDKEEIRDVAAMIITSSKQGDPSKSPIFGAIKQVGTVSFSRDLEIN